MKTTKNISWLQDTILGAAFIIRTLLLALHHDKLSEGMKEYINDFLKDANTVETAVKNRKQHEN